MADFWSTVQDAADNAPEAGYANINYGRLDVIPRAVSWHTTEEYNDQGKKKRESTKRDMKEGDTLKEGESLELNFIVNISELNPNIQFEYERNVTVRKSGRVKTDWSEIVEPSLIAVFGKQWAKAILGKGLYVEVEGVPNVAGK